MSLALHWTGTEAVELTFTISLGTHLEQFYCSLIFLDRIFSTQLGKHHKRLHDARLSVLTRLDVFRSLFKYYTCTWCKYMYALKFKCPLSEQGITLVFLVPNSMKQKEWGRAKKKKFCIYWVYCSSIKIHNMTYNIRRLASY